MAKPTMLQSLLNRPSQTYSFPQEKAYYSTKRDMVRIATETRGGEGPRQEHSNTKIIVESAAVHDPRQLITDHVCDTVNQKHQKPLSITDFHNDNDSSNDSSDSDSQLDVFYTPNSSPRTSVVVTGMRSTKTPVVHSNTSTTSLSSSLGAPSLFSLPASDSTRITTPVHSDAGHTLPAKPPPTNRDWAKDVRWLVPDRDSAPEAKSTITPSPTPHRRRHISETPSQHPQKSLPPSKSHPKTRSKLNTPISKSISKTNPSIMSSMAALLEEDEPHMCDQNPMSSVLISRTTSTRQGSYSSKNRMPPFPALPTPTPIPKSRSPSPNGLRHKRSRSLGHTSTTPPSSNQSHSSHTHSRSGHAYASSSSDPFHPSSTSLPTFTPGNLPSHGTRGFTSLVLPRAPVPFAQSSSKRHHHQRIGAGLLDSIGAGADGKVDLTSSGVAQTTMASVEVVSGLSGDVGGGSGILGKGKLGKGGGKGVMGLFRRGGSASPSSTSSGPSSAFGTRSPSKAHRKRSQSENGMVLGNGSGYASTQRGGPECPLGFTSYRKPPGYVPGGGVLVQVWAVGVDGVDARLVLGGASCNVVVKEKSQTPESGLVSPGADLELSRSTTPVPLLSGDEKEKASSSTIQLPMTPSPNRTTSLRSTLGRFARSSASPSAKGNSPINVSNTANATGNGNGQPAAAAGVGFIPGRSFVGRVLECGWDVGEEVGKRGEWVMGLLDIKKCGALTEFVVVDRRRIHRVPYPRMDHDPLNPFLAEDEDDNRSIPSPSRSSSIRSTSTSRPSSTSRHPTSFSSHANVNSKYAPNRPLVPSPLNLKASRSSRQSQKAQPPPLTLEEMALLPVCGIPAYRAVRTFAFEFAAAGERDQGGAIEGGFDFGSVDAVAGSPSAGLSRSPASLVSGREKDSVIGRDHERGGRKRRALVVRGHDGAGAIAVQMLVRRGWRVCVHVPFGCVRDEGQELDGWYAGEKEEEREEEGRYRYCMRMVEERVRAWGGEEVIFDDGEEADGDDGRGAVVRAIDRLRMEGDVFDAVLDTVGGREVWEASERLLRSLGRNGDTAKARNGKKGSMCVKQFTTLVGDMPGRTIPSAKDNLKAGFRSLNIGVGRGAGDGKKQEGGRKVGYAWVSVAHDVDWEGEDVSEILDAVLRLAVEDGVRPWVGPSERELGRRKGKGKVTAATGRRVVPFEKAPEVFVSGGRALADGGTVVVKVVG